MCLNSMLGSKLCMKIVFLFIMNMWCFDLGLILGGEKDRVSFLLHLITYLPSLVVNFFQILDCVNCLKFRMFKNERN
jgi:hypothetical protein